jgi:hypothetical protein
MKSNFQKFQKSDRKIVSKTLKTIVAMAIFAVLGSCSKSEDDVPQPAPEQVFPPYEYTANVYVAGSTNGKATIWKNGIAADLADGTTATDVFVSGNDVYACGQKQITLTGKGRYWKNGVATTLSSDYNSVFVNSIFVSGGVVYCCGSVQNVAEGKKACYWKNGVATILSNSAGNSADDTATGIYVVGNTTYVCGTVREGAYDPITKVWKIVGANTPTVTPLSTNAKDTFATGITVVGSDVYVVGHEQNINGSSRKPVVFKNSDKSYLPFSASAVEGNAKDITASGTDIFVSGYDLNNLASSNSYFWKNGVATNLTSPTTEFNSRDHSWAPTGITVFNGAVYQSADNFYLGNFNAMFLVGSRPVYLTNSETIKSFANSIFVTPL